MNRISISIPEGHVPLSEYARERDLPAPRVHFLCNRGWLEYKRVGRLFFIPKNAEINKSSPVPPGYMTVTQYAAEFGIGRTKVRKMINSGKLKSTRSGFLWFVLPEQNEQRCHA